MSQSDLHRDLVMKTVAELKRRHPQIAVTADIQQKPGDAVPPKIGGFRPDVYATLLSTSIVIAEAKTDGDIDNSHTYNQLSAFVNYLERKRNGSMILSVTGCGANRAKTLLRFLWRDICVKSTLLSVFDSHDFWMLDSTSGVMWHLI